jgi:peptide/nickel transport system substrate-binding protein
VLQLFAGGASAGLLAACTGSAPVAPTVAPAAAPTTPPKPVEAAAKPTDAAPKPAAVAATPTAQAAAPAPTAGAQPKSGGMLRVGVGAEPANMDGQILAQPQRNVMWLFFDRLIALDSKTQPQPMLATSWELSSNAKQMKMNLRKGVQLHSGRELTSEDVKWSLDRTHDPKSGNGTLVSSTVFLKEIETPDKYTLVLNFAQPWPAFFDVLETINIIDAQSDFKATPVGTGPFSFVEYVPGDHLKMVKNKNYWDTGKPYFDELLVKFFKDQQAMVVQLESEAIDVVDSPPTPDAVRLKADPNYQVLSNPSTGTYVMMAANVTMPPMGNKMVRQALNYAIDRKRIHTTAYNGFGDPRMQIWPETSPTYDPAQAHVYDFDLDKAKAMLAAAGEANLETELTWRNNASESQLVAQIYQADLAKIGVKLNLKSLEPAVWNEYAISGKFAGLSIANANSANLSASSAAAVGTWMSPDNGITGFRSPAWSDLAARVLSETDSTKQKALSVELNKFLLDESWMMPIVSLPPKIIGRKNLRGISFNQHETATYYDAWLA